MGVCVPGTQLQGALEFVFRRRPASLMGKRQGQGGMSLAGCRIDLNGLERGCFRSGENFLWRCKAVPCKPTVTVGQAGIGHPIVRLEIDGLLKIIGSLADSFCGSLVPIITAFK